LLLMMLLLKLMLLSLSKSFGEFLASFGCGNGRQQKNIIIKCYE
jgi:hypothetical protein